MPLDQGLRYCSFQVGMACLLSMAAPSFPIRAAPSGHLLRRGPPFRPRTRGCSPPGPSRILSWDAAARGVRVEAVEETADTIYLVLPGTSATSNEAGGLSDRDLESAAGG